MYYVGPILCDWAEVHSHKQPSMKYGNYL